MKRCLIAGLLGVLGLVGGIAEARGEIVIQTPRRVLRFGPRSPAVVTVQAPPAVQVEPQPPVVQPPPGVPLQVLPQPVPVPGPVPGQVVPLPAPAPVVVPVLTHREFARMFQPLPGTYEVVLLHPVTCCPVKVCFTLPPGCPKKVRVERRELEFDYGRHEVEIRFVHNGTVRVEYR